MKKILGAIVILAAIAGISSLTAAENWEGEDNFTSPTRWYEWQKKGKNGEQGRLLLRDGKLVYSALSPYPDGLAGAVWLWGQPKKPVFLPTAACWEVRGTLEFPASAPVSGVDVAVAGLCITLDRNPKAAMYGGLWASYLNSSNAIADKLQFARDLNVRPGFNNDAAPVSLGEVPTGNRKFTMFFRHDALRRQDTFEVVRADDPAARWPQTVLNSGLSGYSQCQVGPFMMVGENQSWPGTGSQMSMREWSVKQIDPEPINLAVWSSTSRGVAYSVAVTNLDLVNQRLTGTVALTVGTASASLPIKGSIDKNGYFALAASGTKANGTSGFSCKLLYDVATGTYRPNKNTVTAPKQKAIKF